MEGYLLLANPPFPIREMRHWGVLRCPVIHLRFKHRTWDCPIWKHIRQKIGVICSAIPQHTQIKPLKVSILYLNRNSIQGYSSAKNMSIKICYLIIPIKIQVFDIAQFRVLLDYYPVLQAKRQFRPATGTSRRLINP